MLVYVFIKYDVYSTRIIYTVCLLMSNADQHTMINTVDTFSLKWMVSVLSIDIWFETYIYDSYDE